MSSTRCRERDSGDGTSPPAFGDGPLAGFLHAVGWLYVGLGHWFWVLPDRVRRVVSAIYSFFENSMPAPVLRVCGVFGVLAGLAFIYVGVYIV